MKLIKITAAGLLAAMAIGVVITACQCGRETYRGTEQN